MNSYNHKIYSMITNNQPLSWFKIHKLYFAFEWKSAKRELPQSNSIRNMLFLSRVKQN